MEISNDYLWSTLSALSGSATSVMDTTDSTATSSYFADLLATTQSTSSSAYLQEMTSLGAEQLGNPPDFSSMSTEEFREHLIEVQEALAASGADISNLQDPSELTEEELEAMQAEMMSRGQNPPPPPQTTSMELMEMMQSSYLYFLEESSGMLDSVMDSF
ncbi:MAG: hypothetical protein R3Y54_03835 [Eubacteriales bacterium]